jgi:hypothetical protein
MKPATRKMSTTMPSIAGGSRMNWILCYARAHAVGSTLTPPFDFNPLLNCKPDDEQFQFRQIFSS